MEIVLYLLVIVFFLLLAALAYTLVKDFKEIILGLVNMCKPDLFWPHTWVLSPIWLIGYGLEIAFGWNIIEKHDDSDGLKKYPSTENLELNFLEGDKVIISKASRSKAEFLIKDFLEFCEVDLKFEDFKIKSGQIVKIDCPKLISFYDFSILTTHFCDQITESWGIYKSSRLTYYSYSNKRTFPNIVGQTTNGQRFSIYIFDDLYEEQNLGLNQELEVNAFDWKLLNTTVQHDV